MISYLGGGGEIARYSDRGENKRGVFNGVAAEGGVIEVLSAEASGCGLDLLGARLLLRDDCW